MPILKKKEITEMRAGKIQCSRCHRVIPFDYKAKKSLKGSSVITTASISYSVQDDGSILCYDCIGEMNPPETKFVGN